MPFLYSLCYVILFPVSSLHRDCRICSSDIWDESKQGASAKAFGKVDLDYFIQSSIENAESEEELDAEVKIIPKCA